MHDLFDERRYLIPFRATLLPQIFTDVLVIGSGVAGLRCAIEASQNGCEVIVATKSAPEQSSTSWAQGGVAVALDPADSFDQHMQDTLTAGAGLCDESVVRQVVEQAPMRIEELIRWGMRFDKSAKADVLALGREGGHGHHRIVHSDGDATGRELVRTLLTQTRQRGDIRLFEQCFVLDLITLEGQPTQCLGAITHHPRYGLQVIWSAATVLSAGGCGQVYRESTNPAVATGDGLAMAYRAGAQLADMAFMQFHPTTLYVAGAGRSLISEAVRGEGAQLIDRNGRRFMPDYHPQADLAPRDVVAQSILKQMAKTAYSHVYLDCRSLGDGFARRFPGIAEQLRKFDLDPVTQPIPIHPAAHYMIGGVHADAQGQTNVRGLYACGEAACTGLNGANRLASNSLLEGLVFGQIVGRACAQMLTNRERRPAKIISDIPPSQRGELDLADVRSSLRSVMWRHVGIERQGPRLDDVAEMFDFWARYTLDKIFDDRSGWETQNLLLVGALMTRCAQWRCESRGAHARSDYPQALDAFARHDLWTRGQTQPQTREVQDPAPVDANRH